MTASLAAKPPRPQAKFFLAIGIVFAVQVAVILWSSDRSQTLPRKPDPTPVFKFENARAPELVALENPTLFVLPNRQGFSGEGWMKAPRLEFRPPNWTEPVRWLEVAADDLGATFTEYVEAHPTIPFRNITPPEPTLTFPVITPTLTELRPSILRIEGQLAQRPLLNAPELPLMEGPLTNTVVQVLVDPLGNTFSALLLKPGSGSEKADELALQIARNAQFKSIEPTGPDRASLPEPKLMLGTLIFEWQPLPPTNNSVTLP